MTLLTNGFNQIQNQVNNCIFNPIKMKQDTTKGNIDTATLLLFAVFLISIFATIMCIEENMISPGLIFATYSIVFISLTVWSDQKRSLPTIVGFIFYITFVSTLVYLFPKIVAEGIGLQCPYIYLTMVFLGFIYVIFFEPKR